MNPKRSRSHPPRKPDPIRTFTVREPAQLLAFLLASPTGQGRNAIKSMLARGQIAVNGNAETAYDHPLSPGDSVTVSLEKIVQKTRLIGLSILYEDEELIVVQKDAGLLSISSPHDASALTAYRQLMEHVRQKDPNRRVFVVHRLDRDTSGVMMFAKSERIQQALQNDWQNAVKERVYVALVEGHVKQADGTVSSWLKETKTLKMYSSSHPGDGQHAVTHYKRLQSGAGFSLLEVRLETGRKNQIRVHMQDIGHPIVGDKKYGSRSREIGRLGLHASVLAFVHPATGATLRFESPIPGAFLRPFRQDSD
ncbi:RluA family pseudouridine synthase [Cohnella zeiphila]|uniref:Pseudouridine synthase n=1 Tax=Cohnella zeiphila TaxID=2761120 RepID=A0A7X0VTM9_9BACL|nr:RluA family pseudouridine synthase [Cohnella zeiphila]MBB6730116.1 RluA family pseudouridine synthase [Cohnella zeiphila]